MTSIIYYNLNRAKNSPQESFNFIYFTLKTNLFFFSSSKFWCSNCNKVIDSLPSIEHKTGGSTGNQKTKTKQKMFLFCWCGCHSSIFLIIILMIYRLMIFWRYGNKA